MGDIFLQAMIIARAKKGVYLKAPIAAGARAALPRFSSCSGVPKRNLSIYVLHWSREPELSGILSRDFCIFCGIGTTAPMPQGRIVCALALKSIRFRKVLRAFRPESSHAGSQSLIFQPFCTLAYCIAAWAETIASFKEFTLRYNRRLVLQCGLLRSLSASDTNLFALTFRI